MKNNKIENLSNTPEKSPEELLKNLKNSFETYGIQDVECRIEQGNLIIKQNIDEGISGLGYDKNGKNLWLCLEQIDPKALASNQEWNANTLMSLNSKFQGIQITKIEGKIKIEIDENHPAIAMAQMFKKGDNMFLPGEYNHWKLSTPFKLNQETGKWELNIEDWDGKTTQCKIAISDVEADWEDGKWGKNTSQQMKVNL
jgi:hypothetical protein